MAEKRYINPDEFEELAEEKKIVVITFSVGKIHLKEAERLIDTLRPINKKDPGFCYSCRCSDHNHTQWLFGYTDPAVFDEADKKADEEIAKIWNEDGKTYVAGLYNSPDCENTCICPFNPTGE